jgi:hypothetical protein
MHDEESSPVRSVMQPDWSVFQFPDGWQLEDIELDTVRVVTEGVWFAWRKTFDLNVTDIRNGLWWTHSGSHIVSLANGTALHYWNSEDFENYAFRPANIPDDICCHATFDDAERCALQSMRSGRWCRDTDRGTIDDA